jgi:hypothetical protein
MTTFQLIAATAAVLCGLTPCVWGFDTPSAPTSPRVPSPSADPKPAAAGERVADATQRLHSQNNLKQILIGFHTYHDKHGHFPHDIRNASRPISPVLSWRVAILPYIGEEKLYREFKLDEPWDSEHNKMLLARMPDVYRVGFEPKDATTTYYQGFAGPGTMFEPWKLLRLPWDIPDGTSNTLAVVEAGPPVEWTRPADIPYDPKKPLAKLDGPFANVLMAATADGDARPFRTDLDETNLRRLIERNDGQPVAPGALRPPLLPVTREDEELGRRLLGQNDTLIREIGHQLAEHRKLLDELAKRRNPANPAAGLDLDRVIETNKELEGELLKFKKKVELLRKEIEGNAPRPGSGR